MFKEATSRFETLRLAKEIGRHLTEKIMGGKRESTGWESVATGTSGTLLLLMELYRQTGEREYALSIDEAIREVAGYCKESPGNNYSLYTGRAGVVYALIQWYHITGNDSLLEDALALIPFSNQEFFHSNYTSDYLYDGRAGMLLVMLHLYLLTKEPFLLSHISDFAERILAGVHLSANGAYWTDKEERNLKPSCGMAYGTVGIRYVLDQLNRCFKSAVLSYIIDEADRYLDSCWLEDSQGWGDHRTEIRDKEMDAHYKQLYLQGDRALFTPKDNQGWADGVTGILFSGPGTMNRELQERASLRLYRNISVGKMPSNYLYDGLAGLGLYIRQTGAPWAHPILNDVVVSVSNSLDPGSLERYAGQGLLQGELGIVYFLLKAIGDSKPTENILAPFLNDPLPNEDERPELPVRYDEIRKEWIRRDYPRTVYLLERTLPDAWQQHLEMPPGRMDRELPGFHSFIAGTARNGTAAAVYDCLVDVYSLEKKRCEFALCDARSPLEIYLQEWHHHTLVLAQLNTAGDWLLHQKLRISDKIAIFSTRWNWGYNNDFGLIEEKQMDNLHSKPDRFEYIVQVSDKREVVEFALKKDTMLSLHLFDTPKAVSQAVTEIKHYVRSLPEPALRELLITLSESRNTKDFIDQLEPIFLFKIRQWIYRGILMVC